jgi:hypothetical protein
MSNINKFLDNRELAILVWLIIFLFWALTKKNIRESISEIMKVFFQKVIFITTCLMLFYIGSIVYIFYRFGLWDFTLLSETIMWVIGEAFVMYLNSNKVKNNEYFKIVMIDSLKLTVVIEFIVNLYVFNFWIELILVPVFAILIGVLGVSSSKPEYKQVESCLTRIFILVGLLFLSYAIYNIIVDVHSFATINNFKEFLLPVVFTILFLPFIYMLALYLTYDLIFMRISFLIKDKSLARYIRWKTVFSFHLKLNSLNNWHDKIIRAEINSVDDVERVMFEVKTGGT